ncbi:fibronectin type III domain-containing protein, partial [Saccharothrix longispora]|nr:fibronectin type III domain-containing protein [Saccharothrix longispora]
MVALWTAVVLVAGVVVVVIAGGASQPALQFQQVGHWFYNVAQKALLHVDGGTKQVDAKVGGVDASAGSTALAGDREVFLVSGKQVVVFGKSTLRVDSKVDVDLEEEPVGLEVVGGPYLVYREGGTIVRLGRALKRIDAGGPLADPVATSDGTVWVQRTTARSLCRLARDAGAVDCPAEVPEGHIGALSVVDDHAVFVDTTAGAAHLLSADGMSDPVRLDVPLPDDARVAAHGVRGRLPVLDPKRNTLLLADVSGLGTKKSVAPVLPVALEAGEYSAPVSSQDAVILLDLTRKRLLTFGPDGQRKADTPLRAESARITRGEDGRVYVDDPTGEHLFVVDGGGRVTPVDVAAESAPTARTEPIPPP